MTNNKQQTAVEWLEDKTKWHFIDDYDDVVYFENVIAQAKEMESQQSERYATFCLRCINENLPIIRFKDWIKLEGNQQ